MAEPLEFIVRHGAVVLFLSVFVEQMGVPLPATPWILAVGALAVSGNADWLLALSAAVVGSLFADAIWFYLGRYGGHRALKFLCRISLEPDSCVRRTQDLFTRYGMRGVVVAKFIPGLSTVVPPLAGSSGVSAARFFFFDAVGSVLYAGSFILAGAVFSHQLEQVIGALASLGRSALGIILGLAALYVGFKYLQRRRLLKELQMARITVDELHRQLELGENPMILDLRSDVELKQSALMIRGARHMKLDELHLRVQEIPRDRDIVLYCSCPNEVSSARMALLLQRRGIRRVRPLVGGLDAWRERNYPTDNHVFVGSNTTFETTTITNVQTLSTGGRRSLKQDESNAK